MCVYICIYIYIYKYIYTITRMVSSVINNEINIVGCEHMSDAEILPFSTCLFLLLT